MKKIMLIMAMVVSFLLGNKVYSQTASEIIRYGAYETYGSARYMGLSGAMNGIGADLAVVNQNPAAWGGFWKSEFTITGDFNTISSDSYYQVEPSRSSNSSRTSFLIPQAGYVYTSADLGRKTKAWSFGIGYNQLANFSSQFEIVGNNAGSITEYWLQTAKSVPIENRNDDEIRLDLNEYQDRLAFDADALYTYEDDSGKKLWGVDYELNPNAPLEKNQLGKSRGSNGEIYLGGGGNIGNKWLWGVTMGIPIFRYREEKVYTETDSNDDIDFFQRLRFEEYLETSGAGFNAKAGLMGKFDNIRISGAVHTPTWYSLRDDYQNDLQFQYVYEGTNYNNEENSPTGTNSYGVSTPWRFLVSGGWLFGRSGFLDAEVEFIDYKQSEYNFSDSGGDPLINQQLENELNSQIDDIFNSTINFKLGGEFVINENWRARGGVRLDSSPLADVSGYNNSYSLGLGYRADRFYIDAAWVQRNTARDYLVYPLDGFNQPLVKQDYRNSNIGVTFGFKL